MNEQQRDYLAEAQRDVAANVMPNLATMNRAQAERDALRAANAELVAALQAQIDPRAKGWKVTDWDVRDEQARAALAKARQ